MTVTSGCASRPRSRYLLAALALALLVPTVLAAALTGAIAEVQAAASTAQQGPCGDKPCGPPPDGEGPCGSNPCPPPPTDQGPCGANPCTPPPADQGPCGDKPCPAPGHTVDGQGPCGASPCAPPGQAPADLTTGGAPAPSDLATPAAPAPPEREAALAEGVLTPTQQELGLHPSDAESRVERRALAASDSSDMPLWLPLALIAGVVTVIFLASAGWRATRRRRNTPD